VGFKKKTSESYDVLAFLATPREYVLNNRTPTRYRNRFLAEAMVQLMTPIIAT